MRLICLMLCAVAWSAAARPSLLHFDEDRREAYAEYERAILAIPDRDELIAHHTALASEPHDAGSPGDKAVVDWLAQTFEDYGLEVERHEFWAYLSRLKDAKLEIIEPERIELSLKEAGFRDDPFSIDERLDIGWNAYSGSGDVTGKVVYANYGTKADFEKLAELGVDCRGKVVIARYGGNYRGFKVKFAEEAGAAALVIFTDPEDSGYVRGLVYPEGGWANSTCIQRGSIKTLPYAGDPLTPFIEATRDAPRLDPDTVALPNIPVQPVGWQSAQQILERMKGEPTPRGWQGGLPLTYRLTGGDELKVRVRVEQERGLVKTWNVLGTLRGERWPEQKVIIGSHHDAWTFGATDPAAGTICTVEAARAFSEMARNGERPERSIVFAGWGAEEHGIIGSVEWVEANIEDLVENAVAYINLDASATGPNFGSSATPSLRTLIEDVAKQVPTARAESGESVYDAWVERNGGETRFGDMGGGSDHIAFVCHASIPSCSLGGGGSAGTAYHSNYDTLRWYWQTVGDDYEPALMVTRMTIGVASRLANADVIPLDASRYGGEFRRHLRSLSARAVETGLFSEGDLNDGLAQVFVELDATAAEIEDGVRTTDNGAIIAMERAWLDERGVPGRKWFRNLYAASDEDSGYAAWMLPALRYAVERADEEALEDAVARYEGALREIVEAPRSGAQD